MTSDKLNDSNQNTAANNGLPTPVLSLSDNVSAESQLRMKKTAAAVDVAGVIFDQATTRVHEFHRAISDKPLAVVNAGLGQLAKPVTALHNGITDLVYGSVRVLGKGLFTAGAATLKAASPFVNFSPATPAYDKNLNAVASAVSGIVGDQLAAGKSALAPELGFYHAQQKLALNTAALAQAYPEASEHLVVFVHGLCCNEDSWWMFSNPASPSAQKGSYGDHLESLGGRSALYVRYNTGLTVKTNGRRLKRELEALVAQWPVPVKRVTLVGHSMGGLVSRVVLDQAIGTKSPLVALLQDVVCIGSPHEGSPLARVSAKGETLFDIFDLSRPVSKVLGVRSKGVRNLEQGLGTTPVTQYLGVKFHLLGSTIGTFEQPKLADTIGDGLVRITSSLSADGRPESLVAYERTNHMQLLNDAKIRAKLEELTGIA
ncbi:MAG: GPI inositol-deacylase [Burkholderiales bacterium]|nr:GPI inositol-deacylase [Burkholderiales bacterium]